MLSFRDKINFTDPEIIRKIAVSTGFFDEEDVKVTVALAKEALTGQSNSPETFNFLFAEDDGKTCAYACFGQVPESISTFELHWLSTLNEFRGQGIGKKLIEKFLEEVKKQGGTKVFIKTSGIPQYEPTRRFYESCGFSCEARLQDYYDEGNDCLIYSMRLNQN